MKSASIPVRSLFFVGLVFSMGALAGEQVLCNFEGNFDFSKVATSDAKVSEAESVHGSSLRIATGHQKSWPGVTLPAPDGHWDLSAFGEVALGVKNTGGNQVTVYCRVDNPGADGLKNCVTGSLALNPGQAGTLRVKLNRGGQDKLGGKLFGMRGYPVGPGGRGGLDAANITQLLVFVNKPSLDHQFDIDDIRAVGSYAPPTASVTDAETYFPLIDTFGQYKHKEWPGKVRSLAELKERREQEAKELAADSGPKEWNRFGGWAAGPKLEATGFFRVQKQGGRWWLVDPEGRLFFSQGIDCVRMFEWTAIEEREHWFEDSPWDQPELRSYLSSSFALKGHYAGRRPRTFAFNAANVVRKYGPDWKTTYPGIVHQRLRHWGLNTIANWSDQGVRLMRRTPYTDNVSTRRAKNIEGSQGYWGKFPDVFDPSFEESIRRSMAGRKNKSANDPWCIGYFSDNEMSWGNELSLGLATLKSPPEQAAKKVLLADLRSKYRNISRLNQAWGSAYASWETLSKSNATPDSEKARQDLTAFYTKAAERYFRTVRDTIKAAAPNQLYLGCRFAWVNAFAARAAAKHCDVVSFNLYRRSVAEFEFNGDADVPLIIGEFHFGALDRGKFHTGLVPVSNQAARAKAYREYVTGALRHPQFVGCHWFQYQDQPTTGRSYDEENYQIGFVDIADTPYPETIAACREVAERMYRIRASK